MPSVAFRTSSASPSSTRNTPWRKVAMPSVAFRTSRRPLDSIECGRLQIPVAMPSVAFRTSRLRKSGLLSEPTQKSQCLRWPFGLRAGHGGQVLPYHAERSQCLRWPFGLRARRSARPTSGLPELSQCLRWPFGLRDGCRSRPHPPLVIHVAMPSVAFRTSRGTANRSTVSSRRVAMPSVAFRTSRMYEGLRLKYPWESRNAFGGLSDFERAILPVSAGTGGEVAMPSVAFRTSRPKRQFLRRTKKESQCLRWPFGLRALEHPTLPDLRR